MRQFSYRHGKGIIFTQKSIGKLSLTNRLI